MSICLLVLCVCVCACVYKIDWCQTPYHPQIAYLRPGDDAQTLCFAMMQRHHHRHCCCCCCCAAAAAGTALITLQFASLNYEQVTQAIYQSPVTVASRWILNHTLIYWLTENWWELTEAVVSRILPDCLSRSQFFYWLFAISEKNQSNNIQV